MLKERMFGLTNSEGNHGEDVKEYYFYLDSTPTHSYARMLYKYPQAAFPYEQLVAENAAPHPATTSSTSCWTRACSTRIATGTCRSSSPRATRRRPSIRITATNRGPEPAVLHLRAPALVPQHLVVRRRARRGPRLAAAHHGRCAAIAAAPRAARRSATLYCDGAGELLFTDNETNYYRLWGQPNTASYQKDGINDHIVSGRQNAVNPARKGTKSAFHSRATVAPGQSATLRLRLTAREPGALVRSVRRLRPDVRGPQARGRRVLRRADPGVAQRRTPPAWSARATPGCCGRSRPTSMTSSAG